MHAHSLHTRDFGAFAGGVVISFLHIDHVAFCFNSNIKPTLHNPVIVSFKRIWYYIKDSIRILYSKILDTRITQYLILDAKHVIFMFINTF